MQRWYDFIADYNGKPLAGATVRLLNYPALTTATYFTTTDTSSPQIIPMTSGEDGSIAFYAADGHYQLSITGRNGRVTTIPDILIEDPSEGSVPIALSASTSTWALGAAAASTATAAPNYLALSTASGSGGSALIGFLQTGTGATTRTIQAKLRDFVSVKDFGAIGDGVTDDSGALNLAFASGNHIFIPAGTYKISSLLTISGNNFIIRGAGFQSKITTSTLTNLIHLNGINDVTFENLFFETTVNNATENVYGIIYSQDTELTDVSFIKCKFSAANANTNAIKFINETVPIANRIQFIECRFEDLWRMAIEFQNHAADTLVRYQNITIERCIFKNIGSLGGYGFAISLSGYGKNSSIFNNIFQNVILGVEVVSSDDTTIAFNKFDDFLTGGSPISLTGNVVMYRNRILYNTMSAPAVSDIYVWSQSDLVMSGNYWYSTSSANSGIWFRDIIRSRISDETYDSSGSYAVYIEGTSSDNKFMNSRISNLRSGNNFSTVRCYGTGVSDTWLIGCYIQQGTGGVVYDGNNGAAAPLLYLCQQNNTAIDGTVPVALLASTATNAITASTATSVKGTITNDNAVAGFVGEFISQQTTALAVALGNGAVSNISTATLSPGDYEAWGQANFTPAASSGVTMLQVGINTTSASIANKDSYSRQLSAMFTPGSSILTLNAPLQRITVASASTATLFLVAVSSFSTSSMSCDGILNIRRRR